MFMDALLMLSDAQAITGTTAVVSANTIDMGNPATKRDIGVGEGLVLSVAVDVALAGTTPGLTVELIQSANADLSSPDVIGSSGAVSGAANAPAGKIFEVPVAGGRVTKRYLGARYTLTGTSPTITVSAGIVPQSMSSQAVPTNYAKAYTP